MGSWKLTFPSYGALKRDHTFLFSTGQIFCQKLLYHFVAMIVLKHFGIVTHCCAASFSIKRFFCKTNNIFYSHCQAILDLNSLWKCRKLWVLLIFVMKTGGFLIRYLAEEVKKLSKWKKEKQKTNAFLSP